MNIDLISMEKALLLVNGLIDAGFNFYQASINFMIH